MVTGTVAIETGQPMAKTSIWGNKDTDTYKAPNAIPIARSPEVQTAVARLRQLIDAAHSPMIAPTQPVATSVADELAKLASLRDSGVLSQQEFEAAKSRALSA
jgi:hypothetical protein